MTKGLEMLHSIEAMAGRATVQELRRMIQAVEGLPPSLDAEGQAFAEALVLKLEHLLGDQLAQRVCCGSSEGRSQAGRNRRGRHADAGQPWPPEAHTMNTIMKACP
jgi:hypothetical protein